MIAALVAAVLLAAGFPAAQATPEHGGYLDPQNTQWANPNRALTPGAIASRDIRVVCDPFYTDRHGRIGPRLALAVFDRYGVHAQQRAAYEIVHLIAAELGGADTVENLYPVRKAMLTKDSSAADAKTHVDRLLRTRVCSGEMQLDEAQRREVAGWQRAIEF